MAKIYFEAIAKIEAELARAKYCQSKKDFRGVIMNTNMSAVI
jgi:hypothetical protein